MNQFKIKAALLPIFFLLLAGCRGSSASPCDAVADAFTMALDNTAKKISRCTTVEELSAMDFIATVDTVDIGSFPSTCLETQIPEIEKEKMKVSIDSFFDTLQQKTFELSAGFVEMDEIIARFAPFRQQMEQTLEQADTYGELFAGLEGSTSYVNAPETLPNAQNRY